MLVVVEDAARGWVARRPTWRERVACRARGGGLDRALAAGASPEAHLLVSLRATLGVSPRARVQAARTLRRILQDALHPAPFPVRGAPTLQRHRVRQARAEVEALIHRLETPGPLSAAGMAQVRVLLADGSGPLHYAAASRCLREALLEALQAMDGSLTG